MAEPPKDESFIAECLERARTGPAELGALLAGLEDEDALRKPGVGKLSIREHVGHMLEMERDVFGVRIRRVLAEPSPRLDPVDQEHHVDDTRWAGRSFAELVAEWAAERAQNVALVERTGPEEWARTCSHPDLGSGATLADVVGRWSRHDAEHLRQIGILARNSRERNLP